MNKKEKLALLIKRNNELKSIVFKGFKTESELRIYRQTIQNKRIEYFDNLKQIEELEWQLKTPEEQKIILEQRRLAKLKRDGGLL